jgi:hypothetical protein
MKLNIRVTRGNGPLLSPWTHLFTLDSVWNLSPAFDIGPE